MTTSGKRERLEEYLQVVELCEFFGSFILQILVFVRPRFLFFLSYLYMITRTNPNNFCIIHALGPYIRPLISTADLTQDEIAEIEEKGAEGAAAFRRIEWLDGLKVRAESVEGRICSADMVSLVLSPLC